MAEKKVIEAWIEEIRNTGRNLSAWETEFVESVAVQLGRSGKLSPRQEEILERIYSEKTQ